MVKKIQAGEIKGIIRTKGGNTVRFLGEIKDNVYPLVFAKEIENNEIELLDAYTLTGKYSITHDDCVNDIILKIETNEKEIPEHQFKAFDKVLVRDRDDLLWIPEFFSHYTGLELCKYKCIVNVYSQCIPYEGNEHLVGTTDKPKEE